MIVVTELYHRGSAHVPFNAGLLTIVRYAFEDEAILFVGDDSHVSLVRNQLSASLASSIEWQSADVVPRDAGYLRRLGYELGALRRVASRLDGSRSRRLVLTSFDSVRLLAVKLLLRFALKDTSVQVISHGEIAQGVIGGRHRHPWRRFKEVRTALELCANSGIKCLVLEHGIRERILEEMPSLRAMVDVLEHPLSGNEGRDGPFDLRLPIRFGFLGLANEKKGFPDFLRLAEYASREYPGKAEFHLIGRLAPGQEHQPGLRHLAERPETDRLSREEFTERVRKLHFVVMPFASDGYQLRPSGTLLDAVAWRIPVIACRILLFEALFRNNGDLGYLCGDEVEYRAVIGQIIESCDALHYRNQVANLTRLRDARSPVNLAPVYRRICERSLRGGDAFRSVSPSVVDPSD